MSGSKRVGSIGSTNVNEKLIKIENGNGSGAENRKL